MLYSLIPRSQLTQCQAIHRLILASAIALVLAMSGCKGGPLVEPVDATVARSTLKKVLETWERGGTMVELKSGAQKIVVQDIDWSRGMKLKGFKLLDEGREEDANLFCEVELMLEPHSGGEPMKKTVIYVVGTDPVLTVFRAIL